MAYSLKIRQEVVDLVQQGKKIKAVSLAYNISTETISCWVRSQDHYLGESRYGKQPFDLEDKVAVLSLVEAGDLSVRQIADLKNISVKTIRSWIKDKGRILAVYSSQGHNPPIDVSSKSPGEELSPLRTADDKDTKQRIRDLKNENEFLKARVAYLEALMEIKGIPASEFKKKPSTRPSTASSDKASET